LRVFTYLIVPTVVLGCAQVRTP